MTYSEQSKNNKLSITLADLNIDEKSVYDFPRTDALDQLFCTLTTYTPTNQSHYGKKFESYKKLNSKTQEKFIQSVLNGLGIKKVFLYQSFTDRTKNKNNLYNEVIKETDTLLCLRCDNGVVKSLYMSVRNAIAHGNIVKKDNFYVLYSVSDDKVEYTSNITFLLKITKLTNLKALIKTLNSYE